MHVCLQIVLNIDCVLSICPCAVCVCTCTPTASESPKLCVHVKCAKCNPLVQTFMHVDNNTGVSQDRNHYGDVKSQLCQIDGMAAELHPGLDSVAFTGGVHSGYMYFRPVNQWCMKSGTSPGTTLCPPGY